MEPNITYCDKYKDYIIEKREDLIDYRTAYKFPNGYGASVLYSYFSQGLELAVLYFEDGIQYISTGTPITNDVVAHIKDEAELEELLDRIIALKGA